MKVKAVYQGDDIVKGRGVGQFEGIEIPDKMMDFPNERLRVSGTQVVDAAEFSLFFVDSEGQKHIVEGPGWQALECSWDSDLIRVEGSWRVKKDDEKLQETKRSQKGFLRNRVAKFVEKRYPQDMQLLFLNVLATSSDTVKMDRAREAMNWIKSVYSAFAVAEPRIDAKRKREHVHGVDLDLSAFEATDPKVSVSEVL